ncbi:MAG: pilus assembly protein PilM [Planctomycetota bacterium]
MKSKTCSGVPVLRRGAKWGPIGVDIGDDTIKMVQLSNDGKDVTLIAVGYKSQPGDIETDSANWQRWCIDAIRDLAANGRFRGRKIIATIPARDVFIDHAKMPKTKDDTLTDNKLGDAVLAKVKQKLPFKSDGAMIKYIPVEDDIVVIIAAERKIIDRHLAIYEHAGVKIKSICVWPTALINSYTRFFAKRKADLQAVVMLLELDSNHTNAVICRYNSLLFARSLPIGTNHFDSAEKVDKLVSELGTCRQQFTAMHRNARIEHLIFLSAHAEITGACENIARQMKTPALIGDCLAAVKVPDPQRVDIEAGKCLNWATACGLGLS